MAMFRNPKFDELEKIYANGVDFNVDSNIFNLQLVSITPCPSNILEYDWKVTLDDGKELNVSMGEINISYPPTRLESINESLVKLERTTNSYLANAINDKIDEVYRAYR